MEPARGWEGDRVSWLQPRAENLPGLVPASDAPGEMRAGSSPLEAALLRPRELQESFPREKGKRLGQQLDSSGAESLAGSRRSDLEVGDLAGQCLGPWAGTGEAGCVWSDTDPGGPV